MRSRQPKLKPQSVEDVELLLASEGIRAEVDRLAAFYDAHDDEVEEPRIWGYEPSVAEAIHRVAHRQSKDEFDERSYLRAMERNRPLVVQPRVDDDEPVLDYWQAFMQPEFVEFWARFPSRPGSRGHDPGIYGKSLLFANATLGISAHFKANHQRLRDSLGFSRLFMALEETAAISSGLRPGPWGGKKYARALEQAHLVAEAVFPEVGLADTLHIPDAVLESNVKLNQAIHARLGLDEVDLAVDEMFFKGWCPQVGYRSADREAKIRKIALHAQPRTYEGQNGKVKFLGRGYYLVPLIVLQTGAPLIWVITSANTDPPRALMYLLQTLFRLWPDLRVRRLVADSGFDEDPIIEWCLRRYGIQLVARRHKSLRNVEHRLTDESEHPHIAAYYGDGAALCRHHGCWLVRDGYEASRVRNGEPLRLGLLPPGGVFVVRFHCPQGERKCTRSRIQMSENWAALSPYPHSLRAGQPGKHAERLALLSRRNSIEALFSAVQIANKLGLDDADRTRTPKEPTVAALFSIALTARNAMLLADLRIRNGEFLSTPPPDVAAHLGIQ